MEVTKIISSTSSSMSQVNAMTFAGGKRVIEVKGSKPVASGVFNGNLRTLPVVPEWKPGDPIKVIPKRRHVTAVV